MGKTEQDKLAVGAPVNVHAKSGFHLKGGANGHICKITQVSMSSDIRNGFWKYRLGWEQADNPGRKYPICINEYYFLQSEVTALSPMYPNDIKTESLPDV